MSRNIIFVIIIIILVGTVGYFVLVRKSISLGIPIFPLTGRMSEFEGYTETEQQEQCNSYAGTFYGGKEIFSSELAKKAVDAAKDYLKDEVGGEFFKKHYRYKCGTPLVFSFKEPNYLHIPFEVKVTNEDLGIDTSASKVQSYAVDVFVDKQTLKIGHGFLLERDALQGKKWLSRKDVLSTLKQQINEGFKQKINALRSDEISVEPFIYVFESDKSVGPYPRLRLYWSATFGKWYANFCQTYTLSAMDGKVVYEQSCSR